MINQQKNGENKYYQSKKRRRCSTESDWALRLSAMTVHYNGGVARDKRKMGWLVVAGERMIEVREPNETILEIGMGIVKTYFKPSS